MREHVCMDPIPPNSSSVQKVFFVMCISSLLVSYISLFNKLSTIRQWEGHAYLFTQYLSLLPSGHGDSMNAIIHPPH